MTLGLLSGCGGEEGGDSEAVAAHQLEQARKEGAREARQRDRLDSLQKRVKRLEREGAAGASAVVEGSAEETDDFAPTTLRRFHTPNVFCEIRSDGAACTVDSTEETFAFEDGGAAYIESSSRVPQGSGAQAAWDSTVSAGSVTCTIPSLEEPRGIACVDDSSGHGFEASRVPSRQRAY